MTGSAHFFPCVLLCPLFRLRLVTLRLALRKRHASQSCSLRLRLRAPFRFVGPLLHRAPLPLALALHRLLHLGGFDILLQHKFVPCRGVRLCRLAALVIGLCLLGQSNARRV